MAIEVNESLWWANNLRLSLSDKQIVLKVMSSNIKSGQFVLETDWPDFFDLIGKFLVVIRLVTSDDEN